MNFLRKIRQDLVNGKHTTKYIKYAIGEIVLVVIGILIALQVSDWSEQKRNKEIELLYYNRLLSDFDLDKALIQDLIEAASVRIEVSKSILLELDSAQKDRRYFLNQFLTAIRSDTYVPRDLTFKDLISSGNLRLINDVEIKNSLILYYAELDNKQEQIKQNRDEVIRGVFELINSSIDFGIQDYDYVNNILGPDVLQTLSQVDWTKDKNSEVYGEFKKLILFNVAMTDRERQHLLAINSLMDTPYSLLSQKVKNEK